MMNRMIEAKDEAQENPCRKSRTPSGFFVGFRHNILSFEVVRNCYKFVKHILLLQVHSQPMPMKRILFLTLTLLLPWSAGAQRSPYDSVALAILDHMGYIIGDLHAVVFDYRSAWDIPGEEFQMMQMSGRSRVYLQGPDKLFIENRRNDLKHRGFWYNGKKFVYYSYDENNYAEVDAPPTIMETIDTIHKLYGVDFPGADFFYPTFTDDLIDHSDRIMYLGKQIVEGRECYHIMAYNEEMTVQMWIAAERLTLPVKFVIYYKKKPGNPQYTGIYSNWMINPVFPPAVFDFVPPPGARKVEIMPRIPIEEQKKQP